MSSGNRSNGGKRKPPKPGGSNNARERARIAAEQAARRKKRRNYAIAIVAAFVLVVGAGVGFAAWRTYGGVSTGGGKYGQPWPKEQVQAGKPVTVGEDNAPVTVTLFEDFRCIHCRDFEEANGEVLNELQEKGEIKLEIYLLTYLDAAGQTGSLNSANAFACAMNEGFGEAYFHGLFDNFGKAWTGDQLIQLANDVGEPSGQFGSCVNSMQHQDWVSSNMQAAQTKQVQGTPTVFINGEMHTDAGGWNEQDLRDAVEQAKK